MSKCILVVDDDPVNTLLAKKTLESKGYDVFTAKDGLEALEMLKQRMPDAILLDVQMPRLDGYGFIKAKFANPVLNKIPVIVLSALGKTEPLFKRYGVKAYLVKPLNVEDLLSKMQAIAPL